VAYIARFMALFFKPLESLDNGMIILGSDLSTGADCHRSTVALAVSGRSSDRPIWHHILTHHHRMGVRQNAYPASSLSDSPRARWRERQNTGCERSPALVLELGRGAGVLLGELAGADLVPELAQVVGYADHLAR